jgi:hypothetical protein
MNTSTFEFLFEFILLPSINRKRRLIQEESSPALLVVDGHISRCSGKFFSLCILSNIDVVCLPSHVSHHLQPLDCGVNGTFKNSIGYYKHYDDIPTQSDHRKAFVEILLESINKALSVKVIKHSWNSSGLFPFNPYLILEKNFCDSSFTFNK